ncbi:MAG: AmmeMemoRadiSam system protein B [Gammaproteobacteria bacterium]|nr:AmmeMemoRadiSam system protein B [Gammaproteobacteria bacterium]
MLREPAVAGLFYPGDPEVLAAEVDRMLAAARSPVDGPAKALIVPHAGYVYSGPVAAEAFAGLRGRDIRRVVLVGPAHRVAVRGVGLSSAEYFQTPLGQVPVDTESVRTLVGLPFASYADAAHAPEHSLEVQLPFLQRVLADTRRPFRLVPAVVGDASPEQVEAFLEAAWGGPETLILISSDLSHFLDYDGARRRDQATCRAIEQYREENLGFDDACGRLPVAGLLRCARQHRLAVTTLDLRNSGDTAGDRSRVVGYGAWRFTPATRPDQPLDTREQQQLRGVARESIRRGLAGQADPSIEVESFSDTLRREGASFVTLTVREQLRGCIGSLTPQRPLVEDVARNAVAAAFRDPRFEPLSESEFRALEIHIALLGEPEPMKFRSEADLLGQLRVGVDGLILEDGRHRATFLPVVWESLPTATEFWTQLKRKAGLPGNHWSDSLRVQRYTTFSW